MQIVGLTDFYVNEPEFVVQPSAMDVNKLDLEKIAREGKAPLIAVTDILGFFHKSGFKHPVVLVGWNVGFDWQFLERLWRVAGRAGEFRKVFSYRYIDLASVSMFFNAHFGRHGHQRTPIKSSAAFDFFKALPDDELRHTARGDCLAAHNMFHSMFRFISSELLSKQAQG
jgi:DNA polymerase III epsilon subunit-like protein